MLHIYVNICTCLHISFDYTEVCTLCIYAYIDKNSEFYMTTCTHINKCICTHLTYVRSYKCTHLAYMDLFTYSTFSIPVVTITLNTLCGHIWKYASQN